MDCLLALGFVVTGAAQGTPNWVTRGFFADDSVQFTYDPLRARAFGFGRCVCEPVTHEASRPAVTFASG